MGAQALGNLREQQAPQGGPLLLGMAAVSAVLLSTLCAAKWRLAVRRLITPGPLRPLLCLRSAGVLTLPRPPARPRARASA